MIPKLVIVTEIIAPYRIPVFNALSQRRELDLHVVFLSENDPTIRQWRVYTDEIEFQYDVLPSWRRRFGKYNVLLNRGVLSTLNKLRPDAVLCGGYNYLTSWQAAYWARFHHVPLLLWSESTALDKRHGHRPVEFLKAQFLRLCRSFVVPGRSSLNYLKDFGVSDQLIFTAPNAVDGALFSKPAKQARRNQFEVRARRSLPSRYFLFVGRLVKAKGIFELLETYAQLDTEIRDKVGLVFVGDGADRPALMERAARIAPGTIQFPGFIQREGLSDFYALADALIFPTHSDPWGLVVNEAMSCGLPVVVTGVAGCVAELVQDGWNGFVVAPNDRAALASAMTRLASDCVLRTEMGSRSRERIEAYSPEAWAEGLVNAVESLCEG
ncbi:MAG TPA: glycosyltransferase family 4 protein [Candidatus Eremiobacteraceae bacterium]|nr:glycosyltransferase family 4 protein [Candidatus Eremiobacteraceae bacterium]